MIVTMLLTMALEHDITKECKLKLWENTTSYPSGWQKSKGLTRDLMTSLGKQALSSTADWNFKKE